MRSQQFFFLVSLLFVLTGADDAELVQVHVALESGVPPLETIDCNKKMNEFPHEEMWVKCGECNYGKNSPYKTKLWGSNPYTYDSYICKAAQHAGIISRSGGTLYVVPEDPFQDYKGSTRNDITSEPYSVQKYKGMRLLKLPLPITCEDSLKSPEYEGNRLISERKHSTKYFVACPAGCKNKNKHSIYGTNQYSADSKTCIAAIHAGIISDAGGPLYVQAKKDGLYEFLPSPSTQNGITRVKGGLTQELTAQKQAQFSMKDLSGIDVEKSTVKGKSTEDLDENAADQCSENSDCEFWVRAYDIKNEGNGAEHEFDVWLKKFYKQGKGKYEGEGHGKFTRKYASENVSRRGGFRDAKRGVLHFERMNLTGWVEEGDEICSKVGNVFLRAEELDEKVARKCEENTDCVFWVRGTKKDEKGCVKYQLKSFDKNGQVLGTSKDPTFTNADARGGFIVRNCTTSGKWTQVNELARPCIFTTDWKYADCENVGRCPTE